MVRRSTLLCCIPEIFFFSSLRRMQQTSNSQFKLNVFHLTASCLEKKRQQKKQHNNLSAHCVCVLIRIMTNLYIFNKLKIQKKYTGHCGSLSYMVVSWHWDISVTDLLYIAALLVIKAVTSFMQLITLTAASLHFHILPKACFMSRSCWVLYSSGSGRVTNMMS